MYDWYMYKHLFRKSNCNLSVKLASYYTMAISTSFDIQEALAYALSSDPQGTAGQAPVSQKEGTFSQLV